MSVQTHIHYAGYSRNKKKKQLNSITVIEIPESFRGPGKRIDNIQTKESNWAKSTIADSVKINSKNIQNA